MFVVVLVFLEIFTFVVVSSAVQLRNDEEIVSISTLIGSSVHFQIDREEDFDSFEWWRNKTKMNLNDERFRLINRTFLFIERTIIGDQGFYTLKTIDSSKKVHQSYRFHLLLFDTDLVFSHWSTENQTFHVEQSINITCSIDFYADQSFIEGFDEFSFSSSWSMIIYNNNPDRYQLISISPWKYRFIGLILHYEIDRNDHRQHVTCSLFEHRSHSKLISQRTSTQVFNVKYKVFLRGQYFFIRSFPSHSSIEINCEEFDGNPPPVYTLFWTLNGINRTLLNKTKQGKFFISDATWRHRGSTFSFDLYQLNETKIIISGFYTCLAENELNQQPVYQTFRLNVWFTEHQTDLFFRSADSSPIFRQSSSSKSRWFVISLVSTFLFISFVLFVLSIYCFCVQYRRETK